MAVIKMEGLFQGWSYDAEKGIIYDEGGNEYHAGEIRSLFFLKQLHMHENGRQSDISFLKSELAKRLDEAEKKLPIVTIDWGDIQETVVHPWKRQS